VRNIQRANVHKLYSLKFQIWMGDPCT